MNFTNFIIEVLLFLIALSFTIWWFNLIIVPIFYYIPKAMYLSLVKRELKAKVILMYLISPVAWIITFTVIYLILVYFIPPLKILVDGIGYSIGQLVAIFLSLYIAICTKEGRKDLKNGFEDSISSYRK